MLVERAHEARQALSTSNRVQMSTPIRAAVITVSDACSRGEREDDSGAALVELLTASGAEVVEKGILSDDLEPLVQRLEEIARRGDVNLILTTGGTGLGPRDNTPEATLRVIEREAPGIAEALTVGGTVAGSRDR